MSDIKYSLIIPCYNEEKNIPILLERCDFVKERSDLEVILVDNGSTDSSSQVLEELIPRYSGCRSIRVAKNQGYGFGILEGLRSAKGEVIGWTHADLQTDPQDVIEGISLFDKHGSEIFVKGKRYGRPYADSIFTIGMSFFESILLKKTLWDINAQPTMFSRNLFDTWDDPPHDFSLDLFVYFLAKKNNIPCYRFPVMFGKRANGVSHWNVDWKSKKKFIERTIEFSLKLKARYK
ncbi:Glycosyl transferase family 2 [Vibrio nigripulchritudo MADA3029]|uniref:glycosyltransferase family 2 protein n=1 Tax=Vibrio nigripulchritudo TaxID=28173 RepID=UPI0003B189F1|nr:glycosyltransferase family 2 protein [Vibrio nigripulchritudo]CCN47649.1 Glycosyl transferase family 2 [Vibrio nigripulchritudo MADA3020]CCN56529.1 Glycosyl transferase family 2 [Vibrio nigripulchritudo MADA3021]CCN58848.1 Glycosyl transferase family 2 [Vibrio nigripulchritudo MADA3029]